MIADTTISPSGKSLSRIFHTTGVVFYKPSNDNANINTPTLDVIDQENEWFPGGKFTTFSIECKQFICNMIMSFSQRTINDFIGICH